MYDWTSVKKVLKKRKEKKWKKKTETENRVEIEFFWWSSEH